MAGGNSTTSAPPANASTSTSSTAGAAYVPPDCLTLGDDCEACWANQCQYCAVGPETSVDYGNMMYRGVDVYTTEYLCFDGASCTTLLYTRPGTGRSLPVPVTECSLAVPLGPPTTAAPARATVAQVAGFLTTAAPTERPSDFDLSGWSFAHWFAIVGPLLLVCSVLGCMFVWARRRHSSGLRKVHVEKEEGGAARWDLCGLGPLTIDRLAKVEDAIADAEKKDGKVASNRCLVFGNQNELQGEHLALLLKLLGRHPALSLSLDADWRAARDEVTLQGLAHLLRLRSGGRGRCLLRTVLEQGGERAAQPLRLPAAASLPAVEEIMESLNLAGHAEVSSVAFVPKDGGTPQLAPVDLAPLRLACTELRLVRKRYGDKGLAAACAFVRPTAARLAQVSVVECDVGDPGAASLARLLKASAGKSLRELVLSANNLKDGAAHELAAALPTCDVLERFLLDRNLVGPDGAIALALKLPRSNVKEMVFGSHLGGNPIGPDGAKALARALDDELARAAANRSTRLQCLALDHCEVGSEGAEALAGTLARSSLGSLSLAHCQIGDAAAVAIVQALPATARSLNLSACHLTDITAQEVAEALTRLPHLAVSVAQNKITGNFQSLLSREHGMRLRL